ncbi:hypothetical protein [Piscinibacter gummiphilus]|uniref:Uncharacterized protein n=1 Tax=Piscinibacter gummiphilus TaxID=946333 RepID=A0ABZ0CQ69_9BURK|nr:hypothetical protein [Piscinibacter gummiphilus]WOB06968.1 hypothetical protein RXV79_18825 [Piscinibacter gummiphilus]
MGISSFIKSLLPSKSSAPAETNTFDVEQFIYVKIPGDIGPMDRGDLFEDQIEPVLAEKNLGTISGGGSSLGDERPDGSRRISFCGIDIDTTSRDDALVVLRDLLPTLNTPVGTELHYTKNGQKLQDELVAEGWLLERPRVFDHPGFGV